MCLTAPRHRWQVCAGVGPAPGTFPQGGLLPLCGSESKESSRPRPPRSLRTGNALFPIKCSSSYFHAPAAGAVAGGSLSWGALALWDTAAEILCPPLRPVPLANAGLKLPCPHTYAGTSIYQHSHQSREFADAPVPRCPSLRLPSPQRKSALCCSEHGCPSACVAASP